MHQGIPEGIGESWHSARPARTPTAGIAFGSDVVWLAKTLSNGGDLYRESARGWMQILVTHDFSYDHRFHESENSMGVAPEWMSCYWCDTWIWDPFLLDWIGGGRPLCNVCLACHLGVGRVACQRDNLKVEA